MSIWSFNVHQGEIFPCFYVISTCFKLFKAEKIMIWIMCCQWGLAKKYTYFDFKCVPVIIFYPKVSNFHSTGSWDTVLHTWGDSESKSDLRLNGKHFNHLSWKLCLCPFNHFLPWGLHHVGMVDLCPNFCSG